MAGQIRMTPETMRERAGEYRIEGENVQSVIEKMDSLLDQLLQEWEGQSAQAYNEKFAELRPGFVRAKELIDEIAKSLEDTANIVEEADQNIASAYRS